MSEAKSNLLKVPPKEGLQPESVEALKVVRSKLGFIPRVYQVYAYSPKGLKRFINFNNGASSLSYKEIELVNLYLSEFKQAQACLSTHSAAATSLGYSEAEILAIRRGEVNFDPRLKALSGLCKAICQDRLDQTECLQNFFEAGYSAENLIDLVLAISAKSCTHLLYQISQAEADFPPVSAIASSTTL